MKTSDLERHRISAELYCLAKGRTIVKQLGGGGDGTVWKTDVRTAVKISQDYDNHARERDSYILLRDRRVNKINGVNVPELVDYRDDILAIEMSVVKPPFLLDFGKAYVRRPAPYSKDPEIMGEWHRDYAERWGENWKTVKRLVSVLQSHGIFYYDPSCNNIQLA